MCKNEIMKCRYTIEDVYVQESGKVYMKKRSKVKSASQTARGVETGQQNQ